MAGRAGAVSVHHPFGRAPGAIALALIAAFAGAALIGLFMAGGKQGFVGPSSYILGLIRISLIQAGLSMVASLIVGAAIAIALARRTDFPGRKILISALNVATVLPAIVTVFAIVAVFGRSGWFGDIGRLSGIETGSWIFGLEGVLIAHIFLNGPLAARVYLAALASIGEEQWRLASQLGMPPPCHLPLHRLAGTHPRKRRYWGVDLPGLFHQLCDCLGAWRGAGSVDP